MGHHPITFKHEGVLKVLIVRISMIPLPNKPTKLPGGQQDQGKEMRLSIMIKSQNKIKEKVHNNPNLLRVRVAQ